MRNYIRMVVLPALCVFAIICTGFVKLLGRTGKPV